MFRRRRWHPTPVLLPGKSHGRRSLVGCSPLGCYESDTTERLHFHFSLSCIGEGNGNPLQCSCLENPRDGGACWAAVYGVAQSRTRLKQLGSSCGSSNIFLFGRFFSFLHFECIISPFWPATFLLKNLLTGGSLEPSCFSLAAFENFSLYLTVDTLIAMCHNVGLFGFLLLGLSRLLESRCLFPRVGNIFSSSFLT